MAKTDKKPKKAADKADKAGKKPAKGTKAAKHAKAAKKAAPQKAASTKADSKKAGSKKADSKKADSKKTASKKAAPQKAASNKAGSKKAAPQKAAPQKAASKKAGSKKAASQRPGAAAPAEAAQVSTPSKGKSGGRTPAPRPANRRRTADLPSTVARSDDHAQETYSAVHESAAEQYGEGEQAHRTAFAALKHTYEKVGDHWEAKDEPGPSDSRAQSPDRFGGETAGGVDANASRAHLYRLAQELDVPGRSRMSKDELVEALRKANERATAKAAEESANG